MKVGIIGAGNIGKVAAQLFIRAGHEVALSNSRGAETLRDLVAALGSRARAATPEEAAAFGEVVLEAIPFGRYRDLPAEQLRGKIVVTASNLYPQRDGEIALNGLSQSELVAAHLSGSRVVKAFNTIYYEQLRDQGDLSKPLAERRAIFVAGDDAEAKRVVSGLIEELGFAPVDTGSLGEGGRRQEPGTAVYNQTLTAGEAKALLASR